MKKVKHRSNRAKDKGGGPDIWMHLHVALAQELILMYIMQTYVPDRAESCITKAVSGLIRVREEQMCWMGFISANKPHLYIVLFFDLDHLYSFPSLSLLKIHLYWHNVLILITWQPSHNYHYSFLEFVLPFCAVYCPKQFTDSFILGWFLNGRGQLLVSCGLFVSSHWGLFSIYRAPKIH